MNPAEKGERYARVFRKAGAFISKGNLARAAEVLKQGVALAEAQGDRAMAKRFNAEIIRISTPPPGGD